MTAPRELSRVATVVFDCDSTLSAIEGIDELAGQHRAEIEALTGAAMRGDVPLEAVYGRRLHIIRPTRAQIELLARQYVDRLVPDAAAVVAALHAEGIAVRVLSGGLRPAVLAAGAALGVAADAVAAVDIYFDERGEYAGFDEASPLARSHGKRHVVAAWRQSAGGRMMLVGDGATDLEASDAADVFVAYAGVAARAPVIAAADAVVRSASLAPVVALALGGAVPQTPGARAVYEQGLALLDQEYRDRFPDPRVE